MEHLTPEALAGPVIGGVMIGLAAVLLMGFNGRIAGISGILGGLFAPQKGDIGWRVAFMGGLVAAPFVLMIFGAPLPSIEVPHPTWMVGLGGLIVGYGTRLGGGCTSGHGVCGMSRLSVRSITATLTFMATGILTVTVLHKVVGI
ncbi:MAG: YeeE/YedE family protein [Alphaproteobacteria bacterium]